MEAESLALERRVQGRDDRPAGPLRVSAMELVLRGLRADFASFVAAHPGVSLTVTATDDEVSLTRREADVVLLSLVRSRATAFLSLPKRWNVALTRAREGLFLVGNLEAYLHAASVGSRELLPQLINRYAQQLGAHRQE